MIEPDEEWTLALIRRWIDEELRPPSREVDQLIDATRRAARAWSERRFGIAESGGGLAAMAMLRSHGTIAQVEDVYTVPEARERGFARTLVTRATEVAHESGIELVFIIADDDSWPKLLYLGLGFEPIGRMWALHRDRR